MELQKERKQRAGGPGGMMYAWILGEREEEEGKDGRGYSSIYLLIHRGQIRKTILGMRIDFHVMTLLQSSIK